ncbi:MAG: hypothetical protein AAFY46_12645, partial [Planctomycetota bacterium]
MASLPPASIWWLGLAAPLPVAWVAWTTARPVVSAVGVAVGTLPLWVYHHAWVASVSLAGVVPLVVYLGLWMAATVAVISCARRAAASLGAAIVVPTAWVGLEYARGELAFGGYAWFLAGHSAVEFLPIASAASIGGVYLVSWLIVAGSGVVIARRYGSIPAGRVGLAISLVLAALLIASV